MLESHSVYNDQKYVTFIFSAHQLKITVKCAMKKMPINIILREFFWIKKTKGLGAELYYGSDRFILWQGLNYLMEAKSFILGPNSYRSNLQVAELTSCHINCMWFVIHSKKKFWMLCPAWLTSVEHSIFDLSVCLSVHLAVHVHVPELT